MTHVCNGTSLRARVREFEGVYESREVIVHHLSEAQHASTSGASVGTVMLHLSRAFVVFVIQCASELQALGEIIDVYSR